MGRGFDFLGYRFSPEGLTIASKTVANFVEQVHRFMSKVRTASALVSTFDVGSVGAGGGLTCPVIDVADAGRMLHRVHDDRRGLTVIYSRRQAARCSSPPVRGLPQVK